MNEFHCTRVLEEDGSLKLDHLPFAKGESIEISISLRSRSAGNEFALRGTVLSFENPTDPVASEDWSASK